MNSQVEEIKTKIDIALVIGERVELKRAGRNLKGLCPFHHEKTPSFMVSPELQIYKCFGCGEAGDVFTFLTRYEGMDFPEALETLAKRAGVELVKTPQKSTSKYVDINTLAARVYHYLLTRHPQGKEALEYLLDIRGLNLETIKEFNIGFAPDKPNTLYFYLNKKKGKEAKDIVDSGLAIFARGQYIDRFRGRIIFPIENIRGQTIALAGRILPKYSNRDVGKYINSPETPIYHKSESLFGLAKTKGDIVRMKKVVVVEGELDFLSPWQAGVKNIVAIKGTAMTEEHVRILSRYAKEFVLAMDSDFAGGAAALKGIAFAQAAGVDVKVVEMGKHKDPDEFVRADKEGFLEALNKPIDVWQFTLDFIFSKHTTSGEMNKSAISREVVPVIASIEDKIMQSYYAGVLANRLGVTVEAVAQEVENYNRKKENTKPALVTQTKSTKQTVTELVEEEMLTVALHTDPNILFENDYHDYFTNPFCVRLAKMLKEYLEEFIEFDIGQFSKTLPPELQEGFQEMVLKNDEEHSNKEDIKTLVKRLQRIRLDEKKEKLVREMKVFESIKDKKAINKAQEEYKRLLEEQQAIDKTSY